MGRGRCSDPEGSAMKRSRAASARRALVGVAALLVSFAVPASGQAASCTPTWMPMTTPQVPNSAWLGGVAAVSDSDVWAVGGYRNWTTQSTLFEHWDGMGWTVLLGPSTQADVDLRGVDAASATDIWAVGLSSASPGYPAIVHWDGT